MRISTLTLFALSASVALVQPLAAGSIVSDGGFESPANTCSSGGYTVSLGDGWTVTAGKIEVQTSCDGSAPHGGSQDVYLDSGSSVNTLSQTLATTVGQSYVVSYWVADTGPDFLSVVFGGQTLYSGGAPGIGVTSSDDYVNYSYTVTATSVSMLLSFTGQFNTSEKGYAGTYLDDVSVTVAAPAAAAEPGSLYLGLLSLLPIRAVRRKFRLC